ncbi:MAG: hypothetical protein LBP75_09275 [Planctomycetota bacterium]|jgi:CheY-like chemotaxis protein|nr:hypothetical protein [Planctomycetota bacterium]
MPPNENEKKDYYTEAELAGLREKFIYMLTGQPLSIIVVDAGATNRRLVVNALSPGGFENIYEARTGAEGLALAKKYRRRQMAAIVDEALGGGMDYSAFWRAFRQIAATGVLILIGNRLPPAKLEAAAKLGAAAVFQRPVKGDALLAKLKELGIG